MGNRYAHKKQKCEDISSVASFEFPRVQYTNTDFSGLLASRIQTTTDRDYRVFLCGDRNGWNRVVPRDRYNIERKPKSSMRKGFARRESISAWVNKIVAYGHSYDESADDRLGTSTSSERSWTFADRLPTTHRRLSTNHSINYSTTNSSSTESSTSSNASSCFDGHCKRPDGGVFYSIYNHSNGKNDFMYSRERLRRPEADVPNARVLDYSVICRCWTRSRRYNGAVPARIYRSRKLPNRDVHPTKFVERDRYRGLY